METKDFGEVTLRMGVIAVGDEGFYVKSFVDDDGHTWFLAIDLAYQLGYDAPIEAVRKYCKHAVYGKGVPNVSDSPIVVPPHDMYNMMLHSDDADCLRFQESICDELCCRYPQLYDVLFDE